MSHSQFAGEISIVCRYTEFCVLFAACGESDPVNSSLLLFMVCVYTVSNKFYNKIISPFSAPRFLGGKAADGGGSIYLISFEIRTRSGVEHYSANMRCERAFMSRRAWHRSSTSTSPPSASTTAPKRMADGNRCACHSRVSLALTLSIHAYIPN